MNLFGAGYGHIVASFEHGNELSGSIKRGELLHKMN
jgi:hypothetical protein